MNDIYIEDSAGEAIEKSDFDVWRIFLEFAYFAGVVACSFAVRIVFDHVFQVQVLGVVLQILIIVAGGIARYIFNRREYLKRKLESTKTAIEKYQNKHGQGKILVGTISMGFMIMAAVVVIHYFKWSFLAFVIVGLVLIGALIVFTEVSRVIRRKTLPQEDENN